VDQTPAHESHNPDLLSFIPLTASRLVEVGCSSGSLAREFKNKGGRGHYTGVELVPEYAELARRHCDRVLTLDIESVDVGYLRESLFGDCWIFGDTLEHLRDPWTLLSRIRQAIGSDGSVVACIPNAQHWSIQAMLSAGAFRYQASGLLDRTHLRWFTRITIAEMFAAAGFRIVEGRSRIFNEPVRELILPRIRELAAAAGADPDQAVADAIPLQYVVRAMAA
jgi:2-polyprenyl-3-methyl-5-hydroxy-6-metoxy-1,4-benzoquinol methylase